MGKFSSLLVISLVISISSFPCVKGGSKEVLDVVGSVIKFGKEHYTEISFVSSLGYFIYTDERSTEVIIINNSNREFFLQDASCSEGVFVRELLPPVNLLHRSTNGFKIASNRWIEGVSCNVEYSEANTQAKFSLLIENAWVGDNVVTSSISPQLKINTKMNVGKGRANQVQIVIT